MKKSFKMITPKSRSDFRNWLAKNYEQKSSIWVVIYKISSGKVNLSVNDVVEEAICFGWIDSVPGKIDSEKYKLLVSPRKPQSVWSAINKNKVKKLIANKLMQPPGLAKIKLAKKNASWDKLNASDRFEMPKELSAGFKKNKKAETFFNSVAPSSRRAILEWINAAKTKETREKRIKETVRLAAIGIRANHFVDLKRMKTSETKMIIQSLGRRTDLIFAKFSGSVVDKGSYTLIQTPTNPGFHWGNYIVFDQGPKMGSLKKWTELFDKEFPYYQEPHHYVFTWDSTENSENHYQEFLDANFILDSATVLTSLKLNPPPKFNNQIQVKRILTDNEWAEVTQLQILCSDSKYKNEYFLQFKERQMASYRKMSESGMGAWFGAFIDEKLVGDLGFFFEGNIGRYQNVGTHPSFRRQGICGTLVYQAGLFAFEKFGVQQLVMEADTHYHAAKIYESVGFKAIEVNHSLSWWKC